MEYKEQVFLSRRNLLTLLSKLDRNKEAGEKVSQCTLIKCDVVNSKFPQTMPNIAVTAVEDNEYYAERDAGVIYYLDDPEKNYK
jgi:hypothetical protein